VHELLPYPGPYLRIDMMENFDLLLISGGKGLCDSAWNKSADAIDHCFKVYFPVTGSATLLIQGQEYSLNEDGIYFISGFDIERQRCDAFMEVYWIHFIPKSLEFLHLLQNVAPFHCWPGEMNFLGERVLTQIGALFSVPRTKKEALESWRMAALRCEVEALLMHLLSNLLEQASKASDVALKRVPHRLKDSIDFMDENFLAMPSLKEVAGRSFLAPNYFHRLFSQIFGVTPMQYMTQRRLDMARELLATTSSTVKEVAFRSGYKNEFHFSRVFKRNIGISPKIFKKRNWQA
jgi:AraC-like DNA-binding protein